MIVKLEMAPKRSVCIIDVIPTITNESPTDRLFRSNDGTTRTPLEVTTGIRPCCTLVQIIEDETGPDVSLLIEWESIERVVNITELQAALHALHEDVLMLNNACKQQSIDV